ncbi:MAG: calcium-binding protein, partial [Pseudomonadota bacterium]
NNVTGTNGSDFLLYQGQLGQFTATITNPYSGYSLFIDEELNLNTGNYDGLGGTDVLIMSSMGDGLFINDGAGNAILANIEILQAGAGGDVIVLADADIVLDDIIIRGAGENDILWGNVGNDIIKGDAGNDIIDGGPGNDSVEGDDGNDRVSGGDGEDTVLGGDGNDTLFGDLDADVINGGAGNDILHGGNGDGSIFTTVDKEFTDDIVFPGLIEGTDIKLLKPPGDPSLGIVDGNLDINVPDAQAEITFRKGFAGYNNTLGVYSIADDGTIESARILWENVKDAGKDVTHVIDLPSGEGEIGFFIIANGDRRNDYDGLDTGVEGNVQFYFDFGGANQRLATVNDSGTDITAVYDDGVTQQVLRAPIYHTTDRGGSSDINLDGKTHVLSGLMPGTDGDTGDVLRIGFEDLPMLGDADYEDVLFDFNVIEQTSVVEGEVSDDILNGGDGDDILHGEGGNDILIGGDGNDQLYGGFGSDIILYDLLVTGVDTIFGFETGVGGDVINITDILVDYDGTDDILEFVNLSDDCNGNTELSVNVDGDAGGTFEALAIIDGGIGNDTLSDLINNGNLVVDQSVVI